MNLSAKLLGRTTIEKVTWMQTEELSMSLKSPSPPMVIDDRGPEESGGPLDHIDDAQNIPLDHIPACTTDLLSKQRPVVFVCHTDRRSAAAAEHLRRAGGSEIAVLRGGMVAWRSRPMP